MTIPEVPDSLLDRADRFEPWPEMEHWARATFIEGNGPLHNPEHAHLRQARIGFVVTTSDYAQNGKRVLGTCQVGRPSGKPWSAGRASQQLVEWFGFVPDFVITLEAIFLSVAEPYQVCAG